MNSAGAMIILAIVGLFVKLFIECIGYEIKQGTKPIRQQDRARGPTREHITDGELYWFDRNHEDIF